ncbi:aspartate aminotransferase family protein [Allokutzneria sp. A3M-2-11 16]|uniref:aspartate aminotransferase family protein n=1 Tax=Allokutzneria sp. A3M-2-11 16 TaxID=2962043 RepID=UPI0020B721B8|nr:aspartate aminotransferase family protein [Allokutzneria sp. A3M-2-11 16]MCP3800648.1 aspartate aminotransferase family protein [Allokutzneria sp. A3M-2-11 16]
MSEATVIVERFRDRTPGSLKIHEAAKNWLPGGDTRTINHYTPYPVFMAHGRGCTVTDVDGNDYLDLNNNMSAIVHGHAHPALVAAATEQIALGTALGAPTKLQAEHAEVLCSAIPALEKIRYCNSGTEATMLAIRTARAFTGRELIVKIAGGYHGLHNDVQINMFTGMSEPTKEQDDLPDWFPAAQIPRGVPFNTVDNVFLLPFNNIEAAEELFSRHGSRIACIIVEPMLSAAGGIPATADYLHGLRRITEEHGALLVLDECATFRLGPLQGRYGITPDLMTLSKIIGGGLPMGAFGGRNDVMAQYDPTRPDPLYHAGAFGGNNLSLAVGLAALRTFGPAEIERLNATGERLKLDISAAAKDVGVKLEVTGIGSLCHMHWGEGEISDAQDALDRRTGLGTLPELFHLELTNRGMFISRRGLYCLSLPMAQDDLDSFVAAVHGTLETLKPYIARELPHLIRSEG